MDAPGGPIAAASQARMGAMDERPLPPVPPNAEQPNLSIDPNEAAVYDRWLNAPHETQSDAARQYERWRDSGFRGSPSNYARNASELTAIPSATSSQLRSRENSTSSRNERGNGDVERLVNDSRVDSSFPMDGLSRPRADSSARQSVNSNMSNSASSSRERSVSHTPSSQSRYRRQAPAPPEVVVPRWQPDSEVTICPICRTQFSFFVRKHHCRKCGRVVCNSCSPHRITIPYQYIVQQPSDGTSPTTAAPTRPAIGPARAGSSSSATSIGGGERVRLCNPCVPDPNVAPPQVNQTANPSQFSSTPSRHGRSVSSANSPYGQYQRPQAPGGRSSGPITVREALRNAPRRPRDPGALGPYYPSQPQSLQSRGTSYNSRDDRRPGSEFMDSRSRSSTVGEPSRDPYNMGNSSSNLNDSSNNLPGGQRYQSLIPRSEADLSRPLPPQPQPQPQPRPRPRVQIPEEDECWICHGELPSRTLPNFEDLRSQHVEACIASAMQGSPPPSTTQTATSQATSSTSTTTPPVAPPSQPPTTSHQQRRTGVFPYTATEKDCVDDAECTICLEEFEVGVEMGRLECFCRFHLKCIRDWFASRPGQCPVHQHGGGY
ncbi:hypothetical protein G7Y89_g10693 [Cudoniella acicularis]|uniref:RING-type E3 ubiquitin transferase n=1 Tax=Cudoniella acicularis TaxID=354080 RepID=A0A8H4RFX0_9HELO|nr:hypothetical protein G7Y89_g10693 [Cudoniella acicularis]